jgi:hypothetical protein
MGFAQGTSKTEAAPSAPGIRAAFYYPWYPENWTEGHHWTSVSSEYSLEYTDMIRAHIDQLQYGKIDVGIYSWWGINSQPDKRFATYLKEGAAKSFPWVIYYELDWNDARSTADIVKDFTYLQKQYFSNTDYYKIGGKPVVFLYTPNGNCASVAKWAEIKKQFNLYVSMDQVPNWWTCNKMDSWHAYSPTERVAAVYYQPTNTVYSISVSAGFWSATEKTPRLARDFKAWENGVKAMLMYQPQWQLVYFNEYAEGTNIEPSDASCAVKWCLDYLETLRANR